MLADPEAVAEKEEVTGRCQAIVGRKNILGEKIFSEAPTRTKFRVIDHRVVACKPIGSEGAVREKQSPEMIRIQHKVRGKSLANSQEGASDKQVSPNVRLDGFMGGQKGATPAVAFQ